LLIAIAAMTSSRVRAVPQAETAAAHQQVLPLVDRLLQIFERRAVAGLDPKASARWSQSAGLSAT
jgi:hypothetical protein